MTLQQLNYALGLRKYGSFSLAASSLHISQPALSLQIGKLEKEVGLLIFDRTKSPIKPTSEGSAFLAKAHELVHDAEQLLEFSKSASTSLSGRMKIGIIPTLAPFLVPLFAYSFQDRYKNMGLDINEMITEKVVNGVKEGSLDAGIISTPIDVRGIDTIPLFYEKFFLYASSIIPENQRTLSAVDYSKLWLLEEGNCFRDQINDFCDVNKMRENKDFIYRSNSIDALIRIVDTKGGLTILPELTTLILNEDQEDCIEPIGEPKPKAREVSIIKRKTTNKESMIAVLEEHIKKSVPGNMLTPENLEVVDPNIHLD